MEYACNFIKKETVFIKKETGATCSFIKKETLAQAFSCEFCETSKNTFLTEHLCTAETLKGSDNVKRHWLLFICVFFTGLFVLLTKFTSIFEWYK